MKNLDEIIVVPKLGSEHFFDDKNELNFKILDFWSWNQSNLFENRTRGILAEFIVAMGLKINIKTRVEWDDYDLISNNGKKIEVKSAAYIQSWKQKTESKIVFNISENSRYDNKKNRYSDLYIFCLFSAKNELNIDPMNLSQWDFYIIDTDKINNELGQQKSLSFSKLIKLNPLKCNFQDLQHLNI